MPKNTREAQNIKTFKRFQDMTRILFVCHGSISKDSQKPCKIKGFGRQNSLYYTTTTPLLQRALNDSQVQETE